MKVRVSSQMPQSRVKALIASMSPCTALYTRCRCSLILCSSSRSTAGICDRAITISNISTAPTQTGNME
ncbi:hypothetical protein D3C72_1455210 [compost metagenome]